MKESDCNNNSKSLKLISKAARFSSMSLLDRYFVLNVSITYVVHD